MQIETLYRRLPILAQHLTCSVEGWRVDRQRFGGDFDAILGEARSRGSWDAARLEEYRDQRLSDFVQHCAKTVPYYRRCFRECGVDPASIRRLEDLARLPVLSRAEAQEHAGDLVTTTLPSRQQVVAHTSGTTGGGFRFSTTPEAIRAQWAVWWRYRGWHGLTRDEWCAYFGGRSVVPVDQVRPPFWRYNRPGRQILFSIYHLRNDRLDAYAEEIERRRLRWLHGYPSALAILAGHVLERRRPLAHPIRWITVGAENLLPMQRALIEEAFGVPVRQHYGMAEAVANASECEHGRLHVDEDFAAVEFLPLAGDGFRVVGTNFTNYATPLLRYDVQDHVRLASRPCDCGRPGRVLVDIDGRSEDYVVLHDGARLGRLDHIFKDMTRIREAQVVQRRVGEVIFRVVRAGGYGSHDESRLLREASQRLGRDTTVVVEYVDHLSRSPAGKLRFVVSELAEGRLG